MSKIQTIQPNYQKGAVMKRGGTINNSPAFAGGGLKGLGNEAQDFLLKQCEPKAGFARRKLNSFAVFLNGHKGEVQSQLINAFFTTTFAPIFIAFNPFTNADEKTKKYTALRQPISAGVALACSLPLTKFVNDSVAKFASEGFIPTHDLRIKPDDKYLEKEFKKNYKEAKDKNKFLEENKPKDFDSSKGNSKTFFNACKKEYVSKVNKSREELFSALIAENPENMKIDEVTKTISLIKKDEVLGKEIVKTWQNIPNLATKEAFDKYLSANNVYKVKLSKFLENEFNFEFYKNGQFKPYTINQQLSQIKAVDFLEKIGLIEKDKVDVEELLRVMSVDYQDKKTIGAVEETFFPGVVKPGKAKDMVEALAKSDNRNTHRIVGENAIKSKNLTLGQFFQQLGLKDEKNINIKEFQSFMNKNVSDVLKELSEKHLKGYKLSEKDKLGKELTLNAKKMVDFGKNLVKNKIGKATNHLGTYKGYVGIVVNLPITIISCTILNWLYPRIVERVFPSLVKDDGAKGGNK